MNETNIYDSEFVRLPSKRIESPSRHVIDYCEIGFFIVLMVIGIPINLKAAYRLWKEYISHHGLGAESQLPYLLFKMNLNITDLLILTVFSPAYTSWLITYQWTGGNVSCKILHVLFVFIFCLSSYLITCIAIDRLLGVISMSKPSGGSMTRMKFCKIALPVVYCLSAIVAFPQSFVFKVVTPIPQISQCITIWEEERLMFSFRQGIIVYKLYTIEIWYEVGHILAIFWIPAIVTGVCYYFVLRHLFTYSGRRSIVGGETLDTCISAHTECNEKCPITHKRDRVTSMPSSVRNSNNDVNDPFERGRLASDVGPFVKPYLHPSDAYLSSTPPLAYWATLLNKTGSNSHDEHTIEDISDTRRRSSNWSCVSDWKSNFRHKIMKRTVPVIIGHLVCWTPYNIVSIVSLLTGEEHSSIMHVLHSLQSLVALNALVDPFLYGAFDDHSNPTHR